MLVGRNRKVGRRQRRAVRVGRIAQQLGLVIRCAPLSSATAASVQRHPLAARGLTIRRPHFRKRRAAPYFKKFEVPGCVRRT